MPLPSQRRTFEPAGDAGQFSILTVCTGNICRSPLLAQLLRLRLPEAFPGVSFSIASAGTHAAGGQPMDPPAAVQASRLGVADFQEHGARRLTGEHVASADLVLGLAQEHRTAAVRSAPSAIGRAFTLLEFAAICSTLTDEQLAPTGVSTPEGGLRRVVEAAHRMRGLVASQGVTEFDVPDPYGRDIDMHRAAADAIDEGTTRLLTKLPSLSHTEL